MIAEADLAYMAAVFDMKALVITKHNSQRATPQLVLTVQSVRLDVVENLCRLTGTMVEPRQRERKDWMRRGCNEHCPEAHIHHFMEDSYLPETATWRITGAAAAVVLSSVIPYMRTDRGTSQMLTQLMDNLVTTGQGVGQVRASVRRLAELGWPIPKKMQKLLPAQTAA
jgi:hypothetical protein